MYTPALGQFLNGQPQYYPVDIKEHTGNEDYLGDQSQPTYISSSRNREFALYKYILYLFYDLVNSFFYFL